MGGFGKELAASPMAANARGNNSAYFSSRGVRLKRRKTHIFKRMEKELAASPMASAKLCIIFFFKRHKVEEKEDSYLHGAY